jgi:hypothetical protein
MRKELARLDGMSLRSFLPSRGNKYIIVVKAKVTYRLTASQSAYVANPIYLYISFGAAQALYLFNLLIRHCCSPQMNSVPGALFRGMTDNS